MKQIGQPVQTVEQGVKFTLGFGSVTACLSYFMYSIYPISSEFLNLTCAYGVLLTGQVAYNTLALGLSSEDDNSCQP